MIDWNQIDRKYNYITNDDEGIYGWANEPEFDENDNCWYSVGGDLNYADLTTSVCFPADYISLKDYANSLVVRPDMVKVDRFNFKSLMVAEDFRVIRGLLNNPSADLLLQIAENLNED